MELRPSLRRIYFPVIDLPTFESILFPLGFTALKNCEIKLGDVTYHSLLNDFGPSSVDGWLATIFGAELGVEEDHSEAIENILDTNAGYSRQLLTVLFTDIVGSTELAVKLGDTRWRDLLDNHHAMVRKELLKYQGREIDIAGDGFFATFEMPVNGIRCACAISEAVRKLNITIRAGLHLGECEVIRNAVRGITVHIGARVVAKAEAGKVLVSSTIKDAVAGANLRFKNVGSYTLKGIPGNWNLFSVEEVGTV
jgi:class 3 adenylate cyclase